MAACLGEQALIDAFLGPFRPAPSPRGPGDDCAVLPSGKARFCVTTDALVEGVHFTRAHFSLQDVGHKALAVNLSDLAAMGARPTWFLCALGLPRGTTQGEVRALGSGMAALARKHRIALVGGNVTLAGELSLTLTAAGEASRPLLRQGGRPGDLLYISGSLGDARAGLAVLRQGKGSKSLAFRQRRPTPRVGLGLIAARHASAAIDLSDGLGRDLETLCIASRVGAEVTLARLPVSRALERFAGGPSAAWGWAAAGGEDYELLLAVPPRGARAFERAVGASVKVTEVGRLTTLGGVRLIDRTGKVHSVPKGHDHFG